MYKVAIVQLLLNHFADVKAKTSSGETPLHYVASATNHAAILLEAVLDHGANPFMKTNDGRTPLDMASKYNPDLVPAFRNAMEGASEAGLMFGVVNAMPLSESMPSEGTSSDRRSQPGGRRVQFDAN